MEKLRTRVMVILNKTCAFKTRVADTLEGLIITMSLSFIEMQLSATCLGISSHSQS